jgi:hypothetical protein
MVGPVGGLQAHARLWLGFSCAAMTTPVRVAWAVASRDGRLIRRARTGASSRSMTTGTSELVLYR